ncbi:MAG: acyltransferase family protein [Limisphaerales bacterium]
MRIRLPPPHTKNKITPLSSGNTSTNQSYRPDIDGLHAFAVIAVLLYHADLGLTGGFVGVDVFFVISGFLISSLILKELEAGTFSLATFWERRIRRIFPALFVMIIAAVVAGWFIFFPDDYWALAQSVLAQALLVANFYFRHLTGYFAAAAETKPLLHTWSLAVEEQFYLLFPLLLLAVYRYRRVQPLKLLLLLLALSFGWSVLQTYQHPAYAFYLLPSRAWELLIGAVIATAGNRLFTHRWLHEAAGFLGLILITFAMVFYNSQTSFPGLGALAPCMGTALLIISSHREPSIVGKVLSLKPIVFVGLISYSLYLWHWPILVYAKYLNPTGLTVTTRALLLIASAAIATASWQFVETPFRKKLLCRARPQIFRAFAIGTAVSLVAATIIIRGSGFESRFPASLLAYLDYSVIRSDRKPLDLHRVFKVEVGSKDAAAGKFPIMGSGTASNFEFAVWGDSHAGAIIPVLDELCKKHHVHGIEAVRSSTFPAINFRETTPDADEAAKFNTAVFDFIRKNKIRNVIIAGRWVGYVDSAARRVSFMATVDQLRLSGCKVYVMKDVPAERFDVPRAAAVAALRGGEINSWCISQSEYEEAARPFEQWCDQLAKRGVTVLDPARFFEQNGRCIVLRAGHLLFADSHHLTIDGARELAPLFEPIF